MSLDQKAIIKQIDDPIGRVNLHVIFSECSQAAESGIRTRLKT
jgi:hypothetical protein